MWWSVTTCLAARAASTDHCTILKRFICNLLVGNGSKANREALQVPGCKQYINIIDLIQRWSTTRSVGTFPTLPFGTTHGIRVLDAVEIRCTAKEVQPQNERIDWYYANCLGTTDRWVCEVKNAYWIYLVGGNVLHHSLFHRNISAPRTISRLLIIN